MSWIDTLPRHVGMVVTYCAVIYILSSFIESLFTQNVVWGGGRIMYMTMGGSSVLGLLCYVNGWMQENRHTTMITAARNVNALGSEVLLATMQA